MHPIARIGEARLVELSPASRAAHVAEAPEHRFLPRGDGGGAGMVAAGSHAGHRRAQVGPHALDARAFLRGSVARLGRVVGQVEQLRPAAVDELPVVHRPGAQRRPAAVQPAEEALRIERLGRDPRAMERWPQVASVQLRRRRQAQQAEERRGEVHGAHTVGHHRSRRNAWTGQQERHAQRRLVDEDGVRHLAVLSQRLAVVGEHGDHRIGLATGRAKPVEEAPELRVGEGDLAVVEPAGELRPVGLGGIVGCVGVVEMDPDEERPPARVGEPPERVVDDLVGRPLGARSGDGALPEVLGEGVEALPEAEGGGHRVGPDEGRRAVALRLQPGGERLVARVEGKDDVVAHAVHGRIEAGQDRRVRRPGHGYRGLGLLEPRAPRGEGVEGPRARLARAVDADVVGPQGVDGDEEEVRSRRPVPAPPPEGEPDQNDEAGGRQRVEPLPRWLRRRCGLLALRAAHAGILVRPKQTAPGSPPGPSQSSA